MDPRAGVTDPGRGVAREWIRGRGSLPCRSRKNQTGSVARLALAAVAAGCYNYEPLGRTHLAPSTHVEVTLTESGSEELARYVGPNVLVIRGRFLGAADRGLALSVEAVENRGGQTVEWKGETVVVPGEFVRSLQQRHMAATKTVLLAGASLAGFLAANAAFGPGASGTVPGGGGPPSSSR